MQFKIDLFAVLVVIRSLGGVFLGWLLYLGAYEAHTTAVRVALLVAMAYIMTVSVYRGVRAIKARNAIEKMLKELDKQNRI